MIHKRGAESCNLGSNEYRLGSKFLVMRTTKGNMNTGACYRMQARMEAIVAVCSNQ